MNEWSEEDEFFSKSEELQQQYSDAIALVLRDADAVLGKGFVTYVVDLAEEAFLREVGPDVERPPGHLMIFGHQAGVGFTWFSDMKWPDYVVGVAESIQESLMEDDYWWGKPFPPCPVHPNHPLFAESVAGRACWVCKRGSIEPIEVGHLAESGDGSGDLPAK